MVPASFNKELVCSAEYDTAGTVNGGVVDQHVLIQSSQGGVGCAKNDPRYLQTGKFGGFQFFPFHASGVQAPQMGRNRRVHEHRDSAQRPAAERSSSDLARSVAVCAHDGVYGTVLSFFGMETESVGSLYSFAVIDRRGDRYPLRHAAVFLGG